MGVTNTEVDMKEIDIKPQDSNIQNEILTVKYNAEAGQWQMKGRKNNSSGIEIPGGIQHNN